MTESYREWRGGDKERFPYFSRFMTDGLFTASTNELMYNVYLPHRCESWEITDTPDKAEAIADMEQFIADAQAALARLMEL